MVIKAVYRTHLPGLRNSHIRLFSSQAEVQILTLGSPAWRNFGRLPYRLIHQGPSQVLVCGRIHWHTWSGVRSSCPIISFDFEDEQFREVPKPVCGGLDHWSNIQLVDLGGCLSAAVYNNYREFEIWIMKEYNVKESWIKEFNIGNHVPTSLQEVDWISAQPFKDSKFYGKSSFVCVLGLLETVDEVLLEYKSRALVTCNKKDGTFKRLTFPGLPNWFEVVVHEGSLNWIDTLANDT
ncbi:hypothetical protein Ddye_016094 [Dipteronia dyeriana]|uniref:F-box associated beta-propeller type 3 domain-containing protein n=1 Tax=Dipteronia dyeriana TaxID=168575 RepID=A0AAD9U644_9ROSI|nr:hypothetical protein Ddye_016094 [Dipteronia dyeriana]